MRLLELQNDGECGLAEFTGNNVPRYAILSHTWGLDEEEVTFNDIVSRRGHDKQGYSKLMFCAKRAKEDGLQYSWVDTCCIDKSSSAELTEAINSMFHWYSKADRCYVYLNDVLKGDVGRNERCFQRSKWFTRGWTLQELLAPKAVYFFTAAGELLGSKATLLDVVHEITGISRRALEGQDLRNFSVKTRLDWAAQRETKREEDAAYSLLGILGVHMPLIYGEGRKSAFFRLRKAIDESLIYEQFDSESDRSVRATMTSSFNRVHDKHNISFSDLDSQESAQSNIDASRHIMSSLYFPRMDERRLNIHDAEPGTYLWILDSSFYAERQIDSLVDWLSSSQDRRGLYWVYGKPGSGKSTMMRFLEHKIVMPGHLLPWARNKSVVKLHHFFWGPGSELQKSIVGLLRALLGQLLNHEPLLVSQIIHDKPWAAAAPGAHPGWTQLELQDIFYRSIVSMEEHASILILIDGLDEISGTDSTRDDLIEFLCRVAELQHVKICVSSRPWNVFHDAFEECPKLRLDDLTRSDIRLFVEAQLLGHKRFKHLLHHQRDNASVLINTVLEKARGVFLWVRLVIRELLAGLRDGDTLKMLQRKVDLIPGDLNQNFKRLMDSIPPQQRYEASVLLQIALYEEKDFESLHPLRLIDLSFTDEGRSDFVVSNPSYLTTINLAHREELKDRLESTVRRLNSRCMGLLECHNGNINEAIDEELLPIIPLVTNDASGMTNKCWNLFSGVLLADVPASAVAQALYQTERLTVDFFHRTCRDFLLTTENHDLLIEYSGGQYDAQIAQLAAIIQPGFERLVHRHGSWGNGLYIYPTIHSWVAEGSSFLTLAIDFDMTAYVRQHLTPTYVQGKHGRPLLDYILRPRFPDMRGDMRIGNQTPNAKLLHTVLGMGADPNEHYSSGSVWSLFLCFLADLFEVRRELGSCSEREQHSEYVAALGMMIQAGSASSLPKSMLSCHTDYSHYHYENTFKRFMISNDLFHRRWPSVIPMATQTGHQDPETYYAVKDLLECFRPYLGSDVDRLKQAIHDNDYVDRTVI
ncbi:hypothetical protein SLS59_008076 [Nothophoma quercina]|uniref:HET-domain-containing protein n=1 Tax=Nothophoma quercina TaxID=749835 RepID=A0ABR3QVA8_9PLEO